MNFTPDVAGKRGCGTAKEILTTFTDRSLVYGAVQALQGEMQSGTGLGDGLTSFRHSR